MNSRGFTLLETVIYTVLVGIVMAAVVGTTRAVFLTNQKTQAHLMVQENARSATERILFRIRNANSITAPAIGSDTSLALAMTAAAQNPTIFSVSNGTLFITEGASPMAALTGTHIEVTNINFTRLTTVPPAIRIEFDARLRNRSGSSQATIHIDETASLSR